MSTLMKAGWMLSVALLAASVAPGADDGLVRRLTNRYQGRVYEFMILQSDLDVAPVWGDGEQNPPWSARSALNTAREYAARSVPDSGAWVVNKIALERVGRKAGQWLYVVEFTAFGSDAPVLLGPGRSFSIPILMNGTVVAPKITTAKDVK